MVWVKCYINIYLCVYVQSNVCIYCSFVVVTEPEDYVAISSLITFSPTSNTVICRNITIENDNLFEGTQQFIADLETTDPSIVLQPEMATVNIVDDDSKLIRNKRMG